MWYITSTSTDRYELEQRIETLLEGGVEENRKELLALLEFMFYLENDGWDAIVNECHIKHYLEPCIEHDLREEYGLDISNMPAYLSIDWEEAIRQYTDNMTEINFHDETFYVV